MQPSIFHETAMAFQKGHALVIGVGTHQHHPRIDFPLTAAGLPITVADAQAVAAVLQDPALCGYPPAQVQLISDVDATKAGILSALDHLVEGTSAEDTVFLFYCGHGALGTDSSYYLVSHDARIQSGQVVAGTGVSEAELLDRLRAISAQRMLLVFNACHSGTVSPSLDLEEETLQTRNPPKQSNSALLGTGRGRIIITACGEDQVSLIGTGTNTIFTTALVDGLRGKGVRNNNGFISAFGLYEYIYESISATVKQLYAIQEPELTVLKGVGPFAVSLYKGAPPTGDLDPNEPLPYRTAVRVEEPPIYVGIPAMPNHFVGREAILADLVAKLTRGGSYALSAEGKPGVGKTTLAIALAHHPDIIAHFRGGILWAGLGPQSDAGSALLAWADGLKLDLTGKPTNEARAQAITQAISDRAFLVVIDDAWDLDAAKLLRCGRANTVHLLTTRNQALALQFAAHVETVEELTPEAATDLLQRLAPRAYAADPALAEQLLAAVGYLPLAIELLGGYLNAGARRRFTTKAAEALDELTDPARRLQLAGERIDGSGTLTLQQTIALSLDGVAHESDTAVQAFYALGAFAPKPARFTFDAAQAVTGADEDTLALLADRNLLEQDAEDETFALHQTICDLARTQTPADAYARHCDYYLELVNWFTEDWQVIEAAYGQIQQAWQQTLADPALPHLLPFIFALRLYHERRGLRLVHLEWIEHGLDYVHAHPDPHGEALLHLESGLIYSHLGDNQLALRALAHYEQALSLLRQIGQVADEAAALSNIGRVYSALGNKQQALAYYEQALQLQRNVGDILSEATTLNNIGRIYSALGDERLALSYYEQALSLRSQMWTADLGGIAADLNNIGMGYAALGDRQQALVYLEQALSRMRQVGDMEGEATTLHNIGGVYSDSGDKEHALAHFEQALSLLRRVGDKRGEAATLSNIGALHNEMGDKQQALAYYVQELALRRELNDTSGEAMAAAHVAGVHHALGDNQQALAHYEKAAALHHQVGDTESEATILANIGAIYSALEEKTTALAYFERALPLLRQVGDKEGEAATVFNIGATYLDLGDDQQAVAYLEQALPLMRAAGNASGERIARYDLARAYVGLDDFSKAEEQLVELIQIDEQTHHPNLASNRQILEQLRARRAAQQNQPTEPDEST